MNLTEAAEVLGIRPRTWRLAVERGEIEADHPLNEGPWVFNRHTLKSEAALELVARVQRRGDLPAKPATDQFSLEFSTA